MILPPALAIPWALAKRVPLWIYAAIAVVLLVLWYGSGRYDAGVAHERAAQVKAQEIAIVAIKKQRDRIEAEQREAFAKIGAKLDKEQADESAEKDRLIADLRSGKFRVHKRFSCPPQPGAVPEAAGRADGSDGAGEGGLLGSDAEFLVGEASRANKVVNKLTACQAVLAVERKGLGPP